MPGICTEEKVCKQRKELQSKDQPFAAEGIAGSAPRVSGRVGNAVRKCAAGAK